VTPGRPETGHPWQRTNLCGIDGSSRRSSGGFSRQRPKRGSFPSSTRSSARQACPYRDPGDSVREWERTQGFASLLIEAGRARHPRSSEWIKVGLPWGPKPRLILAHLNAEALRQRSPEIEVEASLSAFVTRIRGFRHGREIRAFKEQLTRLSNATVRLSVMQGEGAFQVNTQIVSSFHL
jgi:Plasmid encoded RepA protein